MRGVTILMQDLPRGKQEILCAKNQGHRGGAAAPAESQREILSEGDG